MNPATELSSELEYDTIRSMIPEKRNRMDLLPHHHVNRIPNK